MNTEFFIAKRLFLDKEASQSLTRPILKIALGGIALGVAVMILAVAIVIGFKREITNKVVGFGSQIQIVNYDSNSSFETIPISKNQEFYPSIVNQDGIKHIQVFATKAGIIKTNENIEGIVLKGIDTDFDWSFFEKHLFAGELFKISDSLTSNLVLISETQANKLMLDVGDKFTMFFVQDPPRARRFTVAGIYKTSMLEFDKLYVLGDIKHIKKLNNWSDDKISGFEVFIDDFNKLDERTNQVNTTVGVRFSEDGNILRVMNIRHKFPQIFDWLNLQDINVWIMLILITMVAGFNMISGLLILILERTNMIGVLKALGSSNSFIKNIFLYQSGFMILKALFWGNIIGIGIAFLQKITGLIKLNPETYFLDVVPIHISPLLIILVNAGSILLILSMLLIPSLIISRLTPERTIRFE